jgi:hypothetical protein
MGQTVFQELEQQFYIKEQPMALEKVTTSDLIEVTAQGHVQVRMRTSIMEDGKEISASFHRYVVAPGETPPDDAPERVKAVCTGVHTQGCIDAYQAAQAQAQANRP